LTTDANIDEEQNEEDIEIEAELQVAHTQVRRSRVLAQTLMRMTMRIKELEQQHVKERLGMIETID